MTCPDHLAAAPRLLPNRSRRADRQPRDCMLDPS